MGQKIEVLRGSALVLSVVLAIAGLTSAAAWAQEEQQGIGMVGSLGVTEATAEIMARQAAAPPRGPRPDHELEYPDRSILPQDPDALAGSRYPDDASLEAPTPGDTLVQTLGVNFDGATLTDTGAFPPDSMGAVGPTQFVVFLNGRLRTFTKAGAADGVLNADPDVFFASVITPVTPPVVLAFTSDPQVRYDRFSARWFLSIIDVPCTNGSCSSLAANRWLVAISDTSTITGGTVWTFFFFKTDATNFCDYPSLGVDVNALYFGCNMFTPAGSFAGINAYVVQKTSILAAGPIGVTTFANLTGTTTGPGPFSPRGVDNADPGATLGYFVGVDNSVFSRVVLRRVTGPGGTPGTPTLSANLNVTVATTNFCNRVPHLGNTGGASGQLDCLDDRLYAAAIRGGTLWTAHNIRTSNAGVASTAATARNSTRWYELENLATVPSIRQSGTVYDSNATLALAAHHWIPAIGVSGQGHVAMGLSIAGTPVGATPAFVGRLAGDALGTMQGPPSMAATTFGTTAASYNPPSDPGGASGRRWGDYSFTSVDPLDDMTMWTAQEYNQATNSYAVRVAQILAPPPATPDCSTPIVVNGVGGMATVVVPGISTAGSGFFDPGADLPPPALPFSHIQAAVTGATVNSVTFDSPTQVTLDLTLLSTGLQDLTITNPDGQFVTVTDCLDIQTLPVGLQEFSIG